MSHRKLAEALTLLSTLAAAARAQQVEVLDPSTPGNAVSEVLISADGAWAAGRESSSWPFCRAVRWRSGSPMAEPLGDWCTSAVLRRIAVDGRVLGGCSGRAGSWTSVGFASMRASADVMAASADGSHAVLNEWTSDGVTALYIDGRRDRQLSPPPGHTQEWAPGISADYRVIPVQTFMEDGPRATYAAGRWIDGVWSPLPDTSFAVSTYVGGISDDGQVVGGAFAPRPWTPPTRPVIWVRDAPAFRIGPDGGESARPLTADGRLVHTGWRESARTWTPWAGSRTDERFLSDAGLAPELCVGVHITSSSADGTVLGAIRTPADQRGIPLRITLPPPCPLDYATDNFIDFFDYLAFTDCFLGDCPNYRSADFNWDGFVDWTDYADFVDAFEAGC